MKGATLVELCVSVAIFLIILGIFYMVLYTNDLTWENINTYIAVQQEARMGMETIIRELRNAENISIPQSDRIDFYSSASGNVSYTLDTVNQRIIRTTTNLTQIIASFIIELSFSQNNDVIQIEISSMKTTKKNRPLNFDLKGQVKLRNEAT